MADPFEDKLKRDAAAKLRDKQALEYFDKDFQARKIRIAQLFEKYRESHARLVANGISVRLLENQYIEWTRDSDGFGAVQVLLGPLLLIDAKKEKNFLIISSRPRIEAWRDREDTPGKVISKIKSGLFDLSESDWDKATNRYFACAVWAYNFDSNSNYPAPRTVLDLDVGSNVQDAFYTITNIALGEERLNENSKLLESRFGGKEGAANFLKGALFRYDETKDLGMGRVVTAQKKSADETTATSNPTVHWRWFVGVLIVLAIFWSFLRS